MNSSVPTALNSVSFLFEMTITNIMAKYPLARSLEDIIAGRYLHTLTRTRKQPYVESLTQ
jgi:hypothetical protein